MLQNLKVCCLIGIALLLVKNANAQTPYFQQEVKYKINVELNDVQHTLNGFMNLEYRNNSNQSLSYIYFNLFANGFRDVNSQFCKQKLEDGNTEFYFDADSTHGYIDGLNFVTDDGKMLKLIINEDTADIAKLMLNQPLQPGQSITISTPFFVKIPKTFSRLGHVGQSYQISQWYPKPAVFDKYGWHPIPYLDQGEYYAEWGSYDVFITLPANYVVAATGDLQTDEEVKFLNSLADSTSKITFYPRSNATPASSSQKKTLHYTQTNVHDFAWFADKRYHVLKGEVELPESKRKVDTWVFYTNHNAEYWKNAIPYMNKAVSSYSAWVGDYAYKSVAAVAGELKAGGGMEYPNVTVISSVSSAQELETVLVHEVGHNWFQGMLGSNERAHPFMDEGINSYYEKRYTNAQGASNLAFVLGGNSSKGLTKFFGLDKLNGNTDSYLGYILLARTNKDQPIDYPSEEYLPINYFGDVYAKTPMAFATLAQSIGQDELDRIMHIYFNEWKFKHPYPEDLKNVFTKNNTTYLDWFFDDLIPTNKQIDYQIVRLNHKPTTIGASKYYKVAIRNLGDMRSPFSLSGIKNDSAVVTVNYAGFMGLMDILLPYGDYDKIQIDASYTQPEINRRNNTIRTSGLFRRTEKLRLQPFGSVENPQRTQVFFTPSLLWNNYDRVMLGMAFYNSFLPVKNMELFAMPMYGVGSGKLSGVASAGYYIYPQNGLYFIKPAIDARQFTYSSAQAGTQTFAAVPTLQYTRINPSFTFALKNKHLRTPVKREINIGTIVLLQDGLELQGSQLKVVKMTSQANQISFHYTNSYVLHPHYLNISITQAEVIRPTLEAGYKWVLMRGKKGISIRAFAGCVSSLKNFSASKDKAGIQADQLVWSLSMSGLQGGNDLLHDNYYLGRNESNGILSRQIVNSFGGFRNVSYSLINPIGQSAGWLNTYNLDADLPIKLPLRLYADLGFHKDFRRASSGYKMMQYGGGVCFHLGEFLKINFPVFLSKDFSDNQKMYIPAGTTFSHYFQRITYSINLNSLYFVPALRNFNVSF